MSRTQSHLSGTEKPCKRIFSLVLVTDVTRFVWQRSKINFSNCLGHFGTDVGAIHSSILIKSVTPG